MGLASDLANSLSAAFQGDLFDAVSEFTYSQISQATYNPSTGVVSTSKSFKSQGIFDALESKSFTGVAADSLDSTLIVLAKDMPVVPELDDEVYSSGRGTFGISSISTDPVGAVYMLALKRQGS